MILSLLCLLITCAPDLCQFGDCVEKDYFSAGTKPCVFDVDGFTIGLMVRWQLHDVKAVPPCCARALLTSGGAIVAWPLSMLHLRSATTFAFPSLHGSLHGSVVLTAS